MGDAIRTRSGFAASIVSRISVSCCGEYPIAGSTGPTSYFAYTSRSEPTANPRGSTISAAPARRAATTPAPRVISPCVSVGPSSITSTRVPAISSGRSARTGLSARITVAPGFTRSMEPSTVATCSDVAESILLMTTASAIRRFASPGW